MSNARLQLGSQPHTSSCGVNAASASHSKTGAFACTFASLLDPLESTSLNDSCKVVEDFAMFGSLPRSLGKQAKREVRSKIGLETYLICSMAGQHASQCTGSKSEQNSTQIRFSLSRTCRNFEDSHMDGSRMATIAAAQACHKTFALGLLRIRCTCHILPWISPKDSA